MINTQREYRIGPLDRLEVTVFGVPELSRTAQVDASGGFSMPLIGTVPAAGLTSAELAQRLAAALGERYIRDPQVSVNVSEVVSPQLTIDGAVKNPGKYAVPNRTTLMQAVAISGGVTEFAKLNDVVVFRTIDNKKMAALFSLKSIRGGRTSDPEVFGNDIIVVGDSSAKRLLRDVAQASPVVGVFYQIFR
jgi:polysaccharide export outer membrane protein